MAVNDVDLENKAGSHWSINKLYHYDSNYDYNLQHAEVIAKKLCDNVGIEVVSDIAKLNAPIQDNTYDCGIYAI